MIKSNTLSMRFYRHNDKTKFFLFRHAPRIILIRIGSFGLVMGR